MTLSPEEISHRSFTPSADGYHKAEVRAFLERVGQAHHELLAGSAVEAATGAVADPPTPKLAGLDQSSGHPAGLAAALDQHDQRLTALEQRLELVIARLEATATAHDQAAVAVSEASDRTAELLYEARAEVEYARRVVAGAEAATSAPPRTAHRYTRPSRDAYVVERPTIAPPAAKPDFDPPSGSQLVAPPEPAGSVGHVATGEQPDKPDTKPNAGPERETVSAAASSRPAVSPPPSSTRAPAFGWDDPLSTSPDEPSEDGGPLISDQTNDLLDGVLDDIMGNITEGPKP